MFEVVQDLLIFGNARMINHINKDCSTFEKCKYPTLAGLGYCVPLYEYLKGFIQTT